MKKINPQIFTLVSVFILLSVFFLAQFVWGWTNPSGNPPTGSGTGLQAYKIGSFTAPASTGNYSVTGVGFRPAMVIFINASTQSGAGVFGVGAATTSTNRFAGSIYSHATNANESRFANNKPIDLVDVSGGTRLAADLISMDSDGFTLNFTTASASYSIIWIAFK